MLDRGGIHVDNQGDLRHDDTFVRHKWHRKDAFVGQVHKKSKNLLNINPKKRQNHGIRWRTHHFTIVDLPRDCNMDSTLGAGHLTMSSKTS